LETWWSFPIFRGAFDGTHRFGEFQKSLGFSKGSLATRLRDLVRCGIFEIVPASDGTAYKEYAIFIADTQVSGNPAVLIISRSKNVRLRN
jgi:DNA-binding HxlR family transcriptional regulator